MTKRPPSLFSVVVPPCNNNHMHGNGHGHGTCFLLCLLLVLVNSLVAGQNETTTTSDTDDMYKNNYGRKFNPHMAIIMVVLVSAFFIMGFFSVYVRQCAERRFMGGGGGSSSEAGGPFAFGRRSLRRQGLDNAVIQTFPTFIYSSVKALKIGKAGSSLECAVCLNDFQDHHLLRLLPKSASYSSTHTRGILGYSRANTWILRIGSATNQQLMQQQLAAIDWLPSQHVLARLCSHVFHHDCVDTWLFSHNTCPVCRANLVPEPGETIEPLISQPEPNPAPTHDEPSLDQVCVSMENNSTVSPLTEQNNNHPHYKSKPPRSRSTGIRFTRLFARSHSTGHSLVQAGEDQERFTLRLPDDVRNRMIIDAQLNRTKSSSTVVFPRARSIRTGYRRSRSGGGRNYERFDKEDRTSPWGFSMTPPFISRTGSVRSPLPRGEGSDQAPATSTRSCSKSGKPSQFDRIFLGLDIENGERSTDSLNK